MTKEFSMLWRLLFYYGDFFFRFASLQLFCFATSPGLRALRPSSELSQQWNRKHSPNRSNAWRSRSQTVHPTTQLRNVHHGGNLWPAVNR